WGIEEKQNALQQQEEALERQQQEADDMLAERLENFNRHDERLEAAEFAEFQAWDLFSRQNQTIMEERYQDNVRFQALTDASKLAAVSLKARLEDLKSRELRLEQMEGKYLPKEKGSWAGQAAERAAERASERASARLAQRLGWEVPPPVRSTHSSPAHPATGHVDDSAGEHTRTAGEHRGMHDRGVAAGASWWGGVGWGTHLTPKKVKMSLRDPSVVSGEESEVDAVPAASTPGPISVSRGKGDEARQGPIGSIGEGPRWMLSLLLGARCHRVSGRAGGYCPLRHAEAISVLGEE
ncbi:hypothetical protein CYMTET_34076, partial [Cymbomonas tetramitiformis]